jgi:F0F1-type ATP synthase delta subunit
MFQSERWAEAFLDAAGAGSRATGHAASRLALAALRALLEAIPPPSAGTIQGGSVNHLLSGVAAADKFCALASRARGGSFGGDEGRALELALHFTALLIRKNRFSRREAVLREIERELDRREGILKLRLESAFPPDADLLARITGEFKSRIGAGDVFIETVVDPELLGGFRLQAGTDLVDLSLKRQLADLENALA